MSTTLDSKVPSGPLDKKWDKHRGESKLVAPNNRSKFDIIVVGSGLAGASAAATLGELGYNVKCFCFQDSPRRAHSIAAQGGINAAKNYSNDGDSVFRLFYDTIKGGDFRSREANVHRLAAISLNIIDQCVAQGVPFAREYGGLLANRSFGGVQVSRTFYARGQTGQQLLLGAYQALEHQIAAATVKMYSRTEMLDLEALLEPAEIIVIGRSARPQRASLALRRVELRAHCVRGGDQRWPRTGERPQPLGPGRRIGLWFQGCSIRCSGSSTAASPMGIRPRREQCSVSCCNCLGSAAHCKTLSRCCLARCRCRSCSLCRWCGSSPAPIRRSRA